MDINIKDKIKNILKKKNNIVFALLFGSQITGKTLPFSDIDLGIYFDNKVNLLEIGRIISELEKTTQRKIDLVILNEIFKKDPLFAYEIISKSELLFSKNDKVLIEFKKRAILEYLDTSKLREVVRKDFMKRIDEKRFGQLNYA